MMPDRIFLWGFMGAGKSFLGKTLADALAWDFIDLDETITREEGKSMLEIFDAHGEVQFRKLEREYLHKVAGNTAVVIACGGGTPCFYDNGRFMAQKGLTVFLDIDPEILADRLVRDERSRPLLEGIEAEKLLPYIERMLEKREHFYLEADLILDSPDADEQVRRIREHLDLPIGQP